MASKSLIINSTSQGGKKLQKTMTFINPDCSNEDAGTFAQMANALTTNTYGSAAIVKKMDVTEEDSGGSGSGTLTVTHMLDNDNLLTVFDNTQEVATVASANGIRINFMGMDGGVEPYVVDYIEVTVQ